MNKSTAIWFAGNCMAVIAYLLYVKTDKIEFVYAVLICALVLLVLSIYFVIKKK